MGIAKNFNKNGDTKNKINTIRKKNNFESTNEIQQLSYVLIIVDKFQEDAIKTIMLKSKCSAFYTKRGLGSATNDIYDQLHLIEKHKSLIFSIVNEKNYLILKEKISQRQHYSNIIMLKIDLSSMVGVTTYKFFSHQDYVKEVK